MTCFGLKELLTTECYCLPRLFIYANYLISERIIFYFNDLLNKYNTNYQSVDFVSHLETDDIVMKYFYFWQTQIRTNQITAIGLFGMASSLLSQCHRLCSGSMCPYRPAALPSQAKFLSILMVKFIQYSY